MKDPNMERQAFKEKVHAEGAKAPKAPSPAKHVGGHESHKTSIHDVVKEHGPAHEVHVKHDHEAKHSSVMSHHGSGMTHEEHFDGESHHVDAHKHAAVAAGADHDGAEHEDAAQDKEMFAEMGSGIPGYKE